LGMTCRGRIQMSGGFFLLMTMLFWLDSGIGFLIPAVAAGFLHEMGHLGVAWWLGLHIKYISLTAIGAEMHFKETEISYAKDLLITAAGPAASLLCAWISAEREEFILAGMCLGQGIFNLLPIYPLDGGRFLHLLLLNWKDGIWADTVTDVFSVITVIASAGGGIALLCIYGNPTLVITACWFLIVRLKRRKNQG